MSDHSTSQSSKSRRSKGMQPPTIEADAKRIEDETLAAELNPTETGAHEQAEATAVNEPEAATGAESPSGEAHSEPSSPPPQKPASTGKSPLISLVLGLVGGVAGAVLMHFMVLSGPDAAKQSDTQIKALETRLAAAETALRDAGQKFTAADKARQDLGAALKTANGRIETLAQQAGSAAGGATDNAADINQRIASLDSNAQAAASAVKTQIDGLQRNVAAANGRFDTLEKQIAALPKSAADPMPAIRYVMVTRLDQALASGKPFNDALKALTNAGINSAALADIAPFAVSGAPTAAALKAEFKAPSEAMIAFERGKSGETFTDKLTRMGKSVLRLRPQGTPDGTDAASMVVRIEAALDRSAFADAASLWNSLPEPLKQLSAPWGKRINDRANAANAMAKLSMSAVAGLEGQAK